MAKKSAETPAKKPRAKKVAPAAAPEEQIGSVNGAESSAEAHEEVPGVAEEASAVLPKTPEAEGQAAPVEECPAETAPIGRPAVVRAPKGLNLRAGPGLNFEVGEVLLDGAEIEVLPLWSAGPQGQFDIQIPGWKYVFTGKLAGWVSSRFLRLEG